AEVSDEVPEGPSRFEGERAALADKGGVAAEDLVEDQAEAPAVEEDVVVAPHEPVRRVAGPAGDQAHQGRLGHVEAALPVLFEELLPGVVGVGPAAPVRPVKGGADGASDDLERLLQPLPGEGGAQDGVAVQGPVPGVLEGRPVEFALDGAADLLEVGGLARPAEGVEEQALLEGGERVGRLDVLRHVNCAPRGSRWPWHTAAGSPG